MVPKCTKYVQIGDCQAATKSPTPPNLLTQTQTKGFFFTKSPPLRRTQAEKNMALDRSKLISRTLLLTLLLLLLLLLGIEPISSSSSISDGTFDSSSSTGRSLLQTKTPCKLNFEFMNYTGLVSRCKGPTYPREPCCDAFLRFACPYADEINDLSTKCSTDMLTYININGKYPPGLFGNQCQGDKKGIPCPENYTRPPSEDKISGVNPSSLGLPASAASLLGLLSLLAIF